MAHIGLFQTKLSPLFRSTIIFLLVALFVNLISPISTVRAAVSPPVFLGEWGSYGTGDGEFDTPMGMAVNTSLGRVYVVDTFNNRIQYFDASGVYAGQAGEYGFDPGKFNFPQGIAIHQGSGKIYLADTSNHRVQVLDQALGSLLAFGTYGTGDGQFRRPYDVTVDADGYIFVADTFNHRIQKFDGSGNFLLKFGTNGSGNGEFVKPSGVAVDSTGNIYVVDEMHRVQKFNSAGVFQSSWGSFGTGEGQFKTPRDIAFDSAWNIYVADTGNHRIQKFTSTGVFISQWGGYGTGNGQFNNPWGVVALGSDEVFVADTDNNRVQRFETNQAPTDINLTPAAVFENRPAGTLVGALSAVDSNVGDTFTFALVPGVGDVDNAAFALTGPTLVTAQTFDYETKAAYSIRVRVTDSGGMIYEEALTVMISNDNDAPTVSGGPFSVDENSAVNTLVGTVAASDTDTTNTSFTYAITNGNTGSAFSMNASGQILVANSSAVDYETSPVFTLTVQVTDDGSPTGAPKSGTGMVIVNVNPVNDPPMLTGFSAGIPENSANGTVVGTMTGSDPDGDTLTYSITNGNTNNAFAINSSTGAITVNNSAALDRETTPSFTLTVTVTDNGMPNLSANATATVTLTDVNEFDPVMNDAAWDLPENSPVDTVVGSMSATDGDTGSTFTYAITAGNGSGAFAINPSTGAIRVANSGPLDRETTPIFPLTVQVTDSGTPARTDTATATITLTNVNEAPTVTAQTMTVPENSINGTSVGMVSVVDVDSSAWTFTVTGGTGSSYFAVASDTGAVTVTDGAALNFEATPSYTLTVRATDGGGLSGSGTVTIDLTDINENPSVPAQIMTIAEGSANGDPVGTVEATDPDAGSSFTFAETGGTGAAVFDVSAGGVVSVVDGSALNYEVTPSYTLNVQVTDNGTPGLTGSGTVTINLTNANEAPVLGDTSFNVDENSANGAVVGTVTASDVDAGSVFTYSITGIVPVTTPAAFAINASTGAITVANSAVLNHEANPVFTLTVQATDNGSPVLSDTATVTVNVNDLNDRPVFSGATFSLAENSPATTVVGTVTATDEDEPGQTLAWTITDGNGLGAFTINSSSGQITVADAAPLDFETNPTFTLTVQVTDNGSPNMTGSATVTINLTNVNEAPVVSDATFTLAENSPTTTVVGTVTATDPENAALTWSITGGNDLGAFAINATSGQITVASSTPLDFETHPTFTLTVRAADPGGLWDEGTVTINLTNANERPVVNAATFSVAENSANSTPVGTVTATDPDHATFTWAITGGNTGNAFGINVSTGAITVTTSSALNFEATPSYTLTVRATDGGGLSGSGTVTIDLTDINENPSVPAQIMTIAEGSVNGATVGTVAATDPDAGSSFTLFAETGGTGAALFDVSSTGVVTVADGAVLNFEGTSSYTLEVQVTDNGTPGLTGSGTVTINLTNENEAPVLNDTSRSVEENSVNGTAVGTPVAATDVDAGSVLSYSITGIVPDTDPAAFAINAGTGAITVANSAVLNHEANPVFTLTVQATDNGSPVLSDTATVTVTVIDLNDRPVVSGATFTPDENSPATTVVGTVTATDEDEPAQTLTWAITDGNGLGALTINSSSGQITVADAAPLDFETNPTFTLTVTATDNGSPNMTGSATVTINLTGVNEAPVVSDATFTLAENSPATTVVGTVTATDPENAALTWSITGGNELGAFTINTTSGQITVASSTPLDLETHPTFSLTVQAADPGGLTGNGTVTINLTNANEPPVVIDNAFYLSENSPVTTLVGIVVANDPDHTTFTWTITGGNTSNAFAINNSGHITVANAAPLDYETTTVFTLTVKAADGGGLFDEGTVTVNLLDANDVPVVTDAAFSILETSANGFVVGSVVATDQDAGQTLMYSITGGNTGNAFAINPATGQITVADNTGFDYPMSPFTLTVQATDNHATNSLSGSGTVTVNILPAADLQLTALVGPTSVISGSTGLYTVQVANIGPGAADAYTVKVTLPAPLTMAATGSAPGCTFAAQVVTCPAAALVSSGTAEIGVAVYIPSTVEGTAVLQAELVPGGGDLDMSNHNTSLTVTVIAGTVVVDDDFEDGADDGWSTDQRSTTPEDGRNFLGEFANQRITFEAHDLPAHSRATISFDLFIIRSWDGNNLMDGPDRWLMDLDGVTLVNTTFSNWNDVLRQQAYPGNYPGGSNPAQTGAEEVNTLGYLYGSDWLEMDAVYHIEMTVDHSAADLIVALEGMGLSGLSEESWGVDNFKIMLSGQQEHKVYLPLMLR